MITRPVIPLSAEFPNALNQLITSYLPARSLELINEKKADFEHQFYIQIPAQNQSEETYGQLIENLQNVVKKIDELNKNKEAPPYLLSGLNSHREYLKKNELEGKNRKAYEKLCIEHEAQLKAAIESYDLPDTEENIAFIRDCIMHYCFLNAINSEDLVAGLMRKKCNPIVLHYLIEQDIDFDWRFGDPEKFILYVAINNDVSTDIIRRMLEYGVNGFFLDAGLYANFLLKVLTGITRSSINGEYPVSNLNFYITPLLSATLFRKEDELVSILIHFFPNQVTLTLEALNEIAKINPKDPMQPRVCYAEDKSLFVKLPKKVSKISYVADRDETGIIDKDLAQQAKTRLIRLLDKDERKQEVPLNTPDKQEFLKGIKEQLDNA